jgi:hypothetical protein
MLPSGDRHQNMKSLPRAILPRETRNLARLKFGRRRLPHVFDIDIQPDSRKTPLYPA